jgi:MoxR-like ATPase
MTQQQDILQQSQQEYAQVDHIQVRLLKPYDVSAIQWLGNSVAIQQLQAAWLKMSDTDLPMNPRLVGKPGVGKTTLAMVVAKSLNLPVYVMQGTSDLRPDDLIITPVLTEGKQISYVASPLVSAMLQGGVCILDEGNRMSEKSWASLAALLDHRRYVDSVITGVRIVAHSEFRFITTMNDDSSVYDLPEYIQSRLNPQIFLEFADMDTEWHILKMAVPHLETDLLQALLQFLVMSRVYGESTSVRDAIQVGKYAQRLKILNPDLSFMEALKTSLIAVIGEDALKFVSPEGPSPQGLRPV